MVKRGPRLIAIVSILIVPMVVSCSESATNVELISHLDSLADPTSDAQFLFQSVAQAEQACMSRAGFEGYNDGGDAGSLAVHAVNRFRSLPTIEARSDGSLGYGEPISDYFVTASGDQADGHNHGDGEGEEDHGHGSAPDHEDVSMSVALMGDVGTASRVEYEVPGVGVVGQVVGGCIEESYSEIPPDDVKTYLTGAFVASNLAGQLRSQTLDRIADLVRRWSECMADAGFEAVSPFDVGSLASIGTEDEVAAVDRSCRSLDQDLDSQYEETLLEVSDDVADDVVPALEEFERLASDYRQSPAGAGRTVETGS